MNYMPSSQSARTGHAPVNGLKVYFEVHGPSRPDVPPLVLLHGGATRSKPLLATFCPFLPGSAKSSLLNSRAADAQPISPTDRLRSSNQLKIRRRSCIIFMSTAPTCSASVMAGASRYMWR
jgi:hypothetical protein